MTTKQHYFATKEDYLTFRKAWAKATNDPRCKKVLKEGKYGKYRTDSWLTAAHHILFNILCNKPIDNGFTPVTNRNKLTNGTYLNHGLYFAAYHLGLRVGSASGTDNRWTAVALERFLEPIVTYLPGDPVKNLEKFTKLLATIEVPEIKVIESNYGRGRKVAKKILEENIKPITYQDLWDLYEEAA